ncbi:hypothetical protein HKCCE2091_19925, partial [Rhodobacterales bacterium HKCCE2091]|nr:hypothetical protein [Rhodobacterales bacterium HKCCE2091]
ARDAVAAEAPAPAEAAPEEAAPAGAAEDAAPSEAGVDQVALLRQRVQRLRDERNKIRDERDELAEELDSYRLGGAPASSGAAEDAAAADTPEDLIAALRDLRAANAELAERSEAMRQAAVAGEGAPGPDLLNAAMAAELLSLRAEKAANAVEMDRILSDMRPLVAGGADA